MLFSPRAICALLHLQTILPSVEFAQIQLCLKKDNLKHWNLSHAVLNSPRAADNEGERRENKTGANISQYAVSDCTCIFTRTDKCNILDWKL